MTGNPSDIQKIEKLALFHAILPPLERCNKLPLRCHMARSDQSHYLQKNRMDHTPLQPKRGKGYISPSFHQHFETRRSLHARPQNTYAQNTIHVASLHHRDEGCIDIFPSFSNFNPDSICLDRGGVFPMCFFPQLLVLSSYFNLRDVLGDLWS